MKNSRILANLAKDVLRLYSFTHDHRLENIFLKLSQDFESALSEWLRSTSKMSELKKKIRNPAILDAILFIQKIKNENPSGINKNDLVTKYFVGTKYDAYIPIVKGLIPLLNHPEVSDVLAPLSNIIQLFNVFRITNQEDPSVLVGDLKTMLSDFNKYRGEMVNEPFEDDDPTLKPQKLNKKQKKEGLLNYLTFKFSEEIAKAFEGINRQDIASDIRISPGESAGSSLLLNPKAIYRLFPNMVGNPMALETSARMTVKDALRDIEPATYEKTYNNIRNSILTSSGVITYEQNQEFNYKQMLNRSKQGAADKVIEPIPVDANKWIYPSPSPLKLLSLVLFSMSARIYM